jgi:hypothetical protein
MTPFGRISIYKTEGGENLCLWDWQIAFCCFIHGIFFLGVVDLSEGWRESI